MQIRELKSKLEKPAEVLTAVANTGKEKSKVLMQPLWNF